MESFCHTSVAIKCLLACIGFPPSLSDVASVLSLVGVVGRLWAGHVQRSLVRPRGGTPARGRNTLCPVGEPRAQWRHTLTKSIASSFVQGSRAPLECLTTPGGSSVKCWPKCWGHCTICSRGARCLHRLARRTKPVSWETPAMAFVLAQMK